MKVLGVSAGILSTSRAPPTPSPKGEILDDAAALCKVRSAQNARFPPGEMIRRGSVEELGLLEPQHMWAIAGMFGLNKGVCLLLGRF